MRPDLDSGTLALLSTGYYSTHWLVEVQNGSGTYIDVSARLVHISGSLPSPDAPIGTLRCEFLREVNDDPATSLAPFIGSDWNTLDDNVTYSALFRVGRRVRARVAITETGGSRPINADFYEFFLGRIAREGSGGRYGSAWFEGNDQGGELQLRKGEAAHVYGAGTLIPDAIDYVLEDDDFAITVNTPESFDTVLGNDYGPGKQKPTWEKVQALATSIGRLCWWRYQADGAADLTLFTPDRNKSGSDFTFPRIMEVNRFDTEQDEIFNVLYGEYSDSDGVRREVGPVVDSGSVAKYGGIRRVGWISEDADSVVRDEDTMLDMVDFAASDLSDPDVIASYKVPLFLWGEVSVDRYTFPADDVHYDEPQLLAPFAIRFEDGLDIEAHSIIDARGRPSGGSGMWKTRRENKTPTEPDAVYQIRNLTIEDNGDGTMTVDWDVGAKITQSWASYSVVTGPETPAKWSAVKNAVLPVTAPITITRPTEESGTAQLGLLWVEGRYVDPATGDYAVGDIERRTVYPKVHIDAIDPDTGDLADGSVKLAKQFASTMGVVKWVATEGDLPADDSAADYYVAADTGQGYQWDGDEWEDWDPASNLTSQTGFFPALLAGVVKAVHITADSLSAIVANLGTVFTGLIANDETTPTRAIRLDSGTTMPGTVTDYIDLAATGSALAVKIGGLEIDATGATIVKDAQTKTIRYAHHCFRPYLSGTSYVGGSFDLTLSDAGYFGAALALPPGATLTRLQFRGGLGDAANDLECRLIRVDAGVPTVLATSVITSATVQQIIDFLTEEVDADATYSLEVFSAYASGSFSFFEWAEIQYTSDNYRQTL